MTVIILAAGYATRLYPLTINQPKCLLKVGGRTILDLLCDKLKGLSQVKELIVVTNAKFFGQLEDWRKAKDIGGVHITVLNDGTTSNETRLGAIGDLQFAIDSRKVTGDVLMLASDNLFDPDFKDFIRFAEEKGEVSVGLHDIGDPRRASKKYGVLETGPDGKIVSIEEKPEYPRSSLIGMGIYYFPGGSLKRIREYLSGPDAKDAPGFYVRWLSERVPVFGYAFPGRWFDIGDTASLEEADRIFKPVN